MKRSLLALVWTVGCFHPPHEIAGRRCDPAHPCGDGLVCLSGRCDVPGAVVDAGNPDGGSPGTDGGVDGGGLADGGPDGGQDGGPPLAALGRIQFVKFTDPSTDKYTNAPDAAARAWLNAHYFRMHVYQPYFDTRVGWYPKAWVYQSLYAVDWDEGVDAGFILKDSSGQKLYYPAACSGSTCPRFAGDIADSAFRSFWISKAQAQLAKGYRGIGIDHVLMDVDVSNGAGQSVTAINSRDGGALTAAAWRGFVAEFSEEIRAALPSAELAQDHVWSSGLSTDADFRRTVEACDYIMLKRGFNDLGIQGGSGSYGFQTFATYIDFLHSVDAGVILHVVDDWGREYAVATYFLISSGRDGLDYGDGGTPDNWWAGFDVSLGAPLGDRYLWNGLWRRDFELGLVLVNEPDEPQKVATLPGSYRGLDGIVSTSVTLGGREGAVLLAE